MRKIAAMISCVLCVAMLTGQAALAEASLYEPFSIPVGDSYDCEVYPACISVSKIKYTESDKEIPFSGRYIAEDNQAENNTLTPFDAEAFARELFAGYETETGVLNWKTIGLTAYSRDYEDTAGPDGDVPNLDFSKPTSEAGYYDFDFQQLIKNVPIVNMGIMYKILNYEKDDPYIGYTRANGVSSATVFSKDEYTYYFAPVQEGLTLVDDAPLLPFSQILPTLEEYIIDGYVREVYCLRFGYMVFDGQEGNYILKPVWYMGTEFEMDRKKNLPPLSIISMEVQKINPLIGIVVDAQTGEAFVPYMTPPDRTMLKPGNLLTWDDVK